MSAVDQVRTASTHFYRALTEMAQGTADSMADVWSHGDAVIAMHPIGGRQVGWEAVRDSFDQVAALSTRGEVELVDQIVNVAGDLAYELGVERGSLELAGETVHIDQRVTNVYRREAGSWKMVHHHSDLSESFVALLARLQGQH